MADINKSVVYTIEINEKGKVNIAGLTKGFVKMDAAVKKLNTDLAANAAATSEASKRNVDLIATSGLAGATLTEVGRTISDSNYGIRGMANNLSQLSTLFITLIAKAGGFNKAISILGSQLMGPLGLILLFQTVVMLFERYSMNSEKAKKSTDNFSGSISKSSTELNNYLNIIEDIVLTQSELNTLLEGAAASDRKFATFLNESNLSQEERNKKIKEYLSLSRVILSVEDDLKKVREEIEEKGGIASLAEIEALEEKIKLEQKRAKLAQKEDRAIKEASIGLLKTELAAAKENASEITNLTLREAELFRISLKYKEDLDALTEKDKDAKSKRVKVSELELDFLKKFFVLDENGRVKMIKGYEEYKKYVLEGAREIAETSLDDLKQIGEKLREEEKMRKESLKNGLAFIKEQAREISEIFGATQQTLGYINGVVNSYHEARMAALARERDYVLNSGRLTGDAQKKAIADIEKRELAAQRRKIKSERDFFTIKQSLLIAEEIMKAKADLASQARKMGIALTDIGTASAVQLGKAKMSLGAFAAEGGLKGMAAYAISIAGMLASIISARKKAESSLAALGAPSGGAGGGLGVEAPDFNIVGASPESQLAQSVSQQQAQPLRAFVVHKDIKNANDLDRTITTTSSLG
jgi:hypothetical protein